MGAINSQKYNTTFIHIPRTGGTSIRKWLVKNVSDAILMPLNIREINVKHPDIWTARKHFGNLGFTFCVVRNPYDRLVSMWAHFKDRKVIGKQTKFKDWVYNHADFNEFMKPMSSWFDEGDIDYIIRFENIEKDFKTIQTKFDCKDDLEKTNNAPRALYKKYYNEDSKLIDFVTEKYKVDLKRFNYSYD